MKRKIYEQLLNWKKEEHGESAVLIEGARRVVLHTKDLAVKNGVTCLPLYMASML